jgi:protein-S-isoprenylcysteine O-methyltransferase Ste14
VRPDRSVLSRAVSTPSQPDTRTSDASASRETTHEGAQRVPADHFGGPMGAASLTFLVPAITFYLWAAIAEHDGQLWLPSSLAEALAMFPAPTPRAAMIFAAWLVLQVGLGIAVPGSVVTGGPLPSGERLQYRLNGLACFAISLALLVAGLATGAIRANAVVAELGPLLTISTLAAFAQALFLYLWGRRRGALERSSGNVPYDFFMGTVLNPRVGLFDLKFFFESHIGMGSWGALAVILPAAQLEETGSLSLPMIVVSACQLLYIADFFVFESNLLSMLDILYENYGFMLVHAFLVWMPFNFTLQQQYLLVSPSSLPAWAAVLLVLMNLAGYAVFRDSNLQKQRFRRDPTRPVWGKPPKTLKTRRGTELLLSGWWGLARHTNYLGDLTMALSWCLACGFGSVVPYFYFLYFAPLLFDRERRDHKLCKEKYGEDWDEYCKLVPYRICPWLY